MFRTTLTNKTPTELTLEDMQIAYRQAEKLKPDKLLVRIDICKKHWEQLKKNLNVKSRKWLVGSLYGPRIVIKPYLKKVKLYYEKQ